MFLARQGNQLASQNNGNMTLGAGCERATAKASGGLAMGEGRGFSAMARVESGRHSDKCSSTFLIRSLILKKKREDGGAGMYQSGGKLAGPR
jgi:hypothetical protein